MREKNFEKREILEVELRYAVSDKDLLLSKITEIGGHEVKHTRTIDHWFIPNLVTNHQEQEQWFDHDRGISYSIREVIDAEGKVVKTIWRTKQIPEGGDHSALLETEEEIESYAVGKSKSELKDRKEFLTIDKERQVFAIDKCELTIDTLAEYGVGVEIEAQDESSKEILLEKIKKLAKKLGLEEGDRYEKSITVAAMQRLAKF